MHHFPRLALSFSVVVSFMACGDDDTSGEGSNNGMDTVSGGCVEFIAATKAYCTEAMDRGLKLNCLDALTRVGVAMEQAGGQLFLQDDEEGRNEVADTFCGQSLQALEGRYAQALEPTDRRAEFPEACADMRDTIVALCIEPLGVEPVPSACSTYIGNVADGHDANVQGAETICEFTNTLLNG